MLETETSSRISADGKFLPKYNWVDLINKTHTVAYDTESFGLEREFLDGTGYCTGFSLCVKVDGEYYYEYIPVGQVRGSTPNMLKADYLPILEAMNSRRVLLFNARHDLRVTDTIGPKPTNYIDLARLTHLHNENYKQSRSLENMCAVYVGPGMGKKKSELYESIVTVLGYGKFTYEEEEEYGAWDAYMTYRLGEATVERLAQKKEAVPVLKYWTDFEQENYEALYNMKTRGVLVNIDKCHWYNDKADDRMATIESELGFDPGKPKNLQRVLIDELGLPQILSKKTGNPTFDKDAMDRYEDILENRSDIAETELAQKILEHRGWKLAKGLYYNKMIEMVHPDGRVRPEYLSHGTVSGRYSCRNPNLQQLPKEVGKKPKPWVDTLKADLFYAQEDYELWEFDYSQLEFRLGAHFANEQILIECFNDSSRDVFNEMAALLSMTRQDSKTLTYTINYGGGVTRLSDVFNMTGPQARKIIDNFYQKYPNLRKVNMFAQHQAKSSGKIQLWTGRYRHFQYEGEAFKAFNSYIQGGAADVVKLAMNRINRELPEVRMLLQVHDSLIFELPVARREYYKEAIMDIMANPGGLKWRVQLKTDGHRLGAG